MLKYKKNIDSINKTSKLLIILLLFNLFNKFYSMEEMNKNHMITTKLKNNQHNAKINLKIIQNLHEKCLENNDNYKMIFKNVKLNINKYKKSIYYIAKSFCYFNKNDLQTPKNYDNDYENNIKNIFNLNILTIKSDNLKISEEIKIILKDNQIILKEDYDSMNFIETEIFKAKNLHEYFYVICSHYDLLKKDMAYIRNLRNVIDFKTDLLNEIITILTKKTQVLYSTIISIVKDHQKIFNNLMDEQDSNTIKTYIESCDANTIKTYIESEKNKIFLKQMDSLYVNYSKKQFTHITIEDEIIEPEIINNNGIATNNINLNKAKNTKKIKKTNIRQNKKKILEFKQKNKKMKKAWKLGLKYEDLINEDI